MKKSICLLALSMLLLCSRMSATLCTAIANGDWSSGATWSCGVPPGNNDTMWIPFGFTVQVDINSPVYANMLIIVDGNLYFDVGQKINMCPGGVYISATGSMGGGNPGSKLNICGSTLWNGPDTLGGPSSLGDVVLPVELLSFTGALNTDASVTLQWKTATETNNSHFTVERSTNGLTFEEIGRVAGHGNSTQEISYSLVDAEPVNGTNYYRLKQTDYNGHYEYVGVVAVEVMKDRSGCTLTVFPNPCQGMCTVNFSDCPNDNDGVITLQLIDAGGQVVNQQVPVRNAEGGFTTVIDASNNLKPGVYIVRGVSSRQTYAERAVLK